MFKEHPIYTGYSCTETGEFKGPSGRLLKTRYSNKKAKTKSLLVKHNGRNLTVQAKVFIYETWRGSLSSHEKLQNIDGNEENLNLSNISLVGSGEDWHSHPKHKKYKATRDGKILGKSGLPVSPVLCKNTGYMRMCMKGEDNESIPYLAHRFIYECITGELIPEGLTINHIDGVKSNNHIDNLECVTQAYNNEHAKRLGLSKQLLETAYQAKLTNLDVLNIKSRLSLGETVPSIWEDYCDKVGLWAIYRIKQGKSWNRLD